MLMYHIDWVGGGGIWATTRTVPKLNRITNLSLVYHVQYILDYYYWSCMLIGWARYPLFDCLTEMITDDISGGEMMLGAAPQCCLSWGCCDYTAAV